MPQTGESWWERRPRRDFPGPRASRETHRGEGAAPTDETLLDNLTYLCRSGSLKER